MRIERISDNQIRCILSKNDLMERHLKISELAYGTEKAKELFRDMMEQASIDFGFETDDIPIMIEAIPTARDSIILVITKVEDPEEFEEKFSHFRPSDGDLDDMVFQDEDEDSDDLPDELMECFDQLGDMIGSAFDDSEQENGEFVPLKDTIGTPTKKKKKGKAKNRVIQTDASRVFSFGSLEEVIAAAHTIGDTYQGKNTVWKDQKNNCYYLFMMKSGKAGDFKQVCDMVGEFGKAEPMFYATRDYMNEHFKVIVKDKALLTLSVM